MPASLVEGVCMKSEEERSFGKGSLERGGVWEMNRMGWDGRKETTVCSHNNISSCIYNTVSTRTQKLSRRIIFYHTVSCVSCVSFDVPVFSVLCIV